MTINLIITAITIWIIFATILPFIILPNFYLRKSKQQNSIYIQKTANKLKAKTKQKTLENIFNFVTKNYTGKKDRLKLALYHKLFNSDIDKILKNKKSFLACHQQNLVISTLLKTTKQFTNKDITKHWNVTKLLTAHQYLIIKINKQKFKVDPFYKQFNNLK